MNRIIILMFSIFIFSSIILEINHGDFVFALSQVTVSIKSPSIGSTLPTGNVTVTGSSSNTTNNMKTVTVSVNGHSPITATPSTTKGWSSWSVVMPVTTSGSSIITAKATDSAGNTNSTNVAVTVMDISLPNISITNPLGSSTVSAGNVTVVGSTSDVGSGVKTVQVLANGSSPITATQSSTGSWSNWSAVISIPKSGSSTITAKATDNAGNVKSTSVSVTVVDKSPPTISIINPLGGSVIGNGNVTVVGSTSDVGSGVKTVQVLFNGSYITAIPVVSNNWSHWNATLFIPKPSSYTITAKATDNAGNVKSTSVSVTVVDKSPPTISITNPLGSSTVSAGNVTVVGSTSDVGTGVKTVQVYVNGSGIVTAVPKLSTNWSSWSASIIFSQPGKNLLMVKAQDNSNNTSVYSSTINVADKTVRLASSPSPTQFLFVELAGFPDMTDLTQLYQKHARSVDIVNEIGSNVLPSSVTNVLPSVKASTFTSIAALKNNATSLHTQGYTWIGYDLEPSLSPANEVADPVGSVQQASQIAHNNGLKLLISPATIPIQDWQRMAARSDGVVLQAMSPINGSITAFTSAVKQVTNLIRTANPNIIVNLQASTVQDTPDQINAAYDTTKNMIDGITVFYNNTSSQIPEMAQVFTHIDGIR